MCSVVTFAQTNPASNTEILADTILKKTLVTSGRMQLLLMIEREQKKADASDGVIDKLIDMDDDLDKTTIISNAIFSKVNKTVAYIENNEKDDMVKRKYLGRVIENLKLFNTDMNDGFVDVNYYNTMSENTLQVIRGYHNNNLVPYIRENISKPLYAVSTLFNTDKDAMNALMEGMADKYPEVLIKKIRNLQNEVAADVIVAKTAPKNPKIILNFATSTAVERDIVRRSKDAYVQTIVKIADSCMTPLKGIFFIDEIYKGKISMSEVNKITSNDEAYFKKMIEMRQEYFTTDLRKIYDRELTHEASRYVSTLNELHDAGEAVRFKIIEKLNPIELYYIIVYGNDDLYTSSFLGCYNRLMTRMKPKSGSQFLDSIGKDKFRTFIRLCANYNTLSGFLETMKPDEKNSLMKDFVTGLDKTLEGDLEGATDVANSFGSISDTSLMKNITEQIRINRDEDSLAMNKKGFKIYDILYTMLTYSNDSMSAKLGIPPITVMPYNNLKDDSGTVVQQVFFYGDKDGKGVFNSYVNGFGAPDWKVSRETYWIKITSIKGKPVEIYANKPLDEPDDEMAQNALQSYLDSMNIHPSIIIHRGHSYHLPTTLEHINYRHKVVILGACGAYQNLSTVLSQSEDAHIVSTKQIGVGKINGPIIRAFNDRLLAGKDIDWVEMWTQLSKQFSSGEMKQMFDDYVPPYKNLGATFLKAYRMSGGGTEE
jgi:5,10-methenyltetrahydromethanopterin hydrogenase